MAKLRAEAEEEAASNWNRRLDLRQKIDDAAKELADVKQQLKDMNEREIAQRKYIAELEADFSEMDHGAEEVLRNNSVELQKAEEDLESELEDDSEDSEGAGADDMDDFLMDLNEGRGPAGVDDMDDFMANLNADAVQKPFQTEHAKRGFSLRGGGVFPSETAPEAERNFRHDSLSFGIRKSMAESAGPAPLRKRQSMAESAGPVDEGGGMSLDESAGMESSGMSRSSSEEEDARKKSTAADQKNLLEPSVADKGKGSKGSKAKGKEISPGKEWGPPTLEPLLVNVDHGSARESATAGPGVLGTMTGGGPTALATRPSPITGKMMRPPTAAPKRPPPPPQPAKTIPTKTAASAQPRFKIEAMRAQFETERSTLKQALAEAKKRNENLLRAKADLQAKFAALKSQFEVAKELMAAELQSASDEFREQRSMLEKEIQELKVEVDRARESADRHIETKAKTKQDVAQERDELMIQLSEVGAKFDLERRSLQGEIAKIEAARRKAKLSLEKHLADRRAEKELAEAQWERGQALREENFALQKQNLEDQLEILRGTASANRGRQAERLQQAQDKFDDRIQDLERGLAQQRAAASTLEEQLRKRIADLEEAIAETELAVGREAMKEAFEEREKIAREFEEVERKPLLERALAWERECASVSLGAGTGWLIRGSDTFRTGFRPVSNRFQTPVSSQCRMPDLRSPCHSPSPPPCPVQMSYVSPPPCTVNMSDAQNQKCFVGHLWTVSFRMHRSLDRNSCYHTESGPVLVRTRSVDV